VTEWKRKVLAEREGFEPDSDPQFDQQVTDSENNSVPSDPQETPWLSLDLSLEIPLFVSRSDDQSVPQIPGPP
jgi:hypothetical protein